MSTKNGTAKICPGCHQRTIVTLNGRLCLVCTDEALSPTNALPGSEEKIRIMHKRALLEIPVSNRFDRKYYDGQIWNFLQAVEKIPTFVERLETIGEEQR